MRRNEEIYMQAMRVPLIGYVGVIRTDRDVDSLKVILNLVVLVAIALVVILAMTPDNAPYWEKLTGASIVAMFFAGISLGVRQVI